MFLYYYNVNYYNIYNVLTLKLLCYYNRSFTGISLGT